MRTLVIAPHMDDEAISCGGLVLRRLAEGHDVGVLCVYGRVYDYGRHDGTDEEERDFFAAKRLLGYRHHWLGQLQEGEPHQVGHYKVLELLEGAMRAFGPDEVVGPSPDDLNQDHRMVAHLMDIALRPINRGQIRRQLEFIALDGTTQRPTYYLPLTAKLARAKLAAIAAYRREARSGTSPRAPDNVLAQMMVWGASSGSSLAEAYRLRFAREAATDESGDHGVERVHRDEPDAVPGQDGA